MSEPTAEERFRHALRTTVADVMPHLAQSLERAFDEVMAGRAVQDGLDVERLAAAWGNVMDGRRVEEVRLDPGTTTPDDWAAIAAEYNRLAAPPLHDPVGEADQP